VLLENSSEISSIFLFFFHAKWKGKGIDEQRQNGKASKNTERSKVVVRFKCLMTDIFYVQGAGGICFFFF
jgi:effector-binding domain-containing protein